MDRRTYEMLEAYMLECMKDAAHDSSHVYRVLYAALEIAGAEKEVDYDILIGACLLHDIGRAEQSENPAIDHAEAGAKKAYRFLTAHGFPREYAERVCACIRSHRYRSSEPPESPEAKILFDADKLDAAGALGIARTLLYQGGTAIPLYTLRPDGRVEDGTGTEPHSFFQEYKFKLERIYSDFFTQRGMELAKKRQAAAVSFYEDLLEEAENLHERGNTLLSASLAEGRPPGEQN